MSLSVCLLTRNEEKSLPRALRSVAGVADELIVVDTGSTDRTVAVGREGGAAVHAFAWDDDFSAARNFALGQAKGDWILWLNPDEELLPASLPLVRACLANGNAFAHGVWVQEMVQAEPPRFATETMQPRLYRHHPAIHSVGRTHPSFDPPLEEIARRENQQVLPSEITLRRHAYQSQPTEAKLRWVARLLERELNDRPGQLSYLIEYGDTLLRLNDPNGHAVMAEAAELLLLVRDAPAAPPPLAQRLLEYLMTVSPEYSHSRLLREEARALAARWFPLSPPMLWRAAEVAFHAGDFRQAAALLERLLELGRTGAYERTQSFDPAILADLPWLSLGACCSRLGELDRAEQCFLRVLGHPKHGAQAARNLAVVQNLRRQAAPPQQGSAS